MMNAEYRQEAGCPQRDSAEHEGYAGAQSAGCREVKEQDGADLLERILSRGAVTKAVIDTIWSDPQTTPDRKSTRLNSSHP